MATNLTNCIIKNHKSFEYANDSASPIDGGTLPNIVVIEIDSISNAPPPQGVGQYGYWYVNASSFSISSCPNVNPISPTSSFTTPQFGGPANQSSQNFSIGNDGKGRVFKETDMDDCPDPTQANLEWDDRISNIMICNKYPFSVALASPQQQIANQVLVYVRFKDNVLMPIGDLTINVKITGEAIWQEVANVGTVEEPG